LRIGTDEKERLVKLSCYAFNVYGHDAKLYNGVHDLETEVELFRALWAQEVREHNETLEVEVERLRKALIVIRAAFDAALEAK
jgi:hypothetical protein